MCPITCVRSLKTGCVPLSWGNISSSIRRFGGGRPVFQGTRIQVHTVLSWLADHPEKDLQEVAGDFRLTVGAVQEALRLAQVTTPVPEAQPT